VAPPVFRTGLASTINSYSRTISYATIGNLFYITVNKIGSEPVIFVDIWKSTIYASFAFDGVRDAPMNKTSTLLIASCAVAFSALSFGEARSTTPTAGAASAIVTGGTAVTLVTGPVNGCYIVNPLTATDQNIATAEVAYINPVTTATTTGRGTTTTLQPGQSWSCVAGQFTNVSANAATSGHAFVVVQW